ncbi:MAG: hypothetical protein EA380_00405 [Phycisphaeraceae bacterium]|nr:MAG: hypothetical protein EA380_00405 [Phycisphaeraceae bacterium]
MNPSNDSLAFDRLIDAADAGFRASKEAARDRKTRNLPWPCDLMGADDQPEGLAEFSLWEMEQATAFLIRLGFIPPRR